MSKKKKNVDLEARIKKIISENTQAELHRKTGLSRQTVTHLYKSGFNFRQMRLQTIEKLLEIE